MRGKLRAMAVVAAVIVGFTVMANEKPSPEYQTAMKNLGTANGALRGNITAKDYPAIEANAATFKASFTVAEHVLDREKDRRCDQAGAGRSEGRRRPRRGGQGEERRSDHGRARHDRRDLPWMSHGAPRASCRI